MNNKNNHKYFSKLIKSFDSEKNVEKALLALTNDLCEEYKFDKVSSFLNDSVSEEFLWVHSYKANDNKTAYDFVYNDNNAIDIENYPLRLTKRDVDREYKLSDLFKNSKVLYTKDVSSISETLSLLNFKHRDVSKIKELLICGLVDESDVVAYCVFENYDNDYISCDDFENIEIFLDTMNILISNNEAFKESNKKYEIKKALSETIQLDSFLVIVEKNSFDILYYESSYGDIFENEKLNKKCYNALFNLNAPCINCPILYNELNESVYSKRNNGDYIERVTEINWRAEKDAYLVSIMDATKAFTNNLSYDILTDSLTWFGFKEEIKNKSNPNEKYTYISLNVEGMKLINDIHTQVVGNEILKQISLTIKNFTVENEFYCRVVADTYAIIIKYIDDENLAERVKQLDHLLTRMCRDIFSEMILVITGGICIIKNNLYDNIDIGFENTGLARNTAKGSYKNTFILYDDDMREQLKANKYIESKIETAIVNNEFSAYLQPKFELSTGKVVGAEALVRWHSEEETIFPDNFIPVFESDGFISVLDFIVYEKIFIFIRQCLDENIHVVPISINASRNHLQDDDFFEKLLALFKQFDVPKELIEIEITENASEGSDEDLKEFVRKLKSENIAVSMDDFGSAYSSLNLLKTLELDTLKLDKEFLGKVEKEKFTDEYSKDEIIIKNIVNMANELGFKVLCEGVETQEQADFLRSIGCNYGQGYILSKPVPLDEFKLKFLSTN